MSKQKIELYVPLHVSAAAARDIAMQVLDAVAKRRAPYEHVMLTAGLRELHVPMSGVVSVPVNASVDPHPLRWECGIVLEAENNRTLFPRFDGTITVTPNGTAEAELWMQGAYEPPLGAIGAGADAALLHGAAEGSLRAFLTWLASEVRRLVEERERETMRAARQTHF
ncbi:MAG: hypothetical protein KGN02_14015 [bacterium]|nr:hypothetical protein [bacterium]